MLPERMKILVLSDIHNNLVAVRRMRDREHNVYDAVVVGGDIGNASALKFFEILSTFECPVLYVYGNWDQELDYDAAFPGDTRLIHLNAIEIGGFYFTGFSGCPTKWGKNPIALKLGDAPSASTRALDLNRNALRRVIAPIDPLRTIVVTHERLTQLATIAPNVLLHIHGHIHKFSERVVKNTTVVNVSVLDHPVTARPRGKDVYDQTDLRNFNAGNYVVIEINGSEVGIECRYLPHNYDGWVPVTELRHRGIEWIAEELKWTDANDPRIARYRESLTR